MCCAIALAMIGINSEMRITEGVNVACCSGGFAGTSIRRTPCDACTRPGLPTSIFGFLAFCRSGGSQPTSNSAPPSIRTSAWRRMTTKLGRASTKCGSSVGFRQNGDVDFVTTNFCATSDPKSGSVATTLSLACAETSENKNCERDKNGFFHGNQNLWAPWAPRMNSNWRKSSSAWRCERKSSFQEVVIVLQSDF